MTSTETMLEAGKQIAAIASGRARIRDDAAEAASSQPSEGSPLPGGEKLAALPNEATVESLNERTQGGAAG